MADYDYKPFWDETINQLRQELGEGEFTIWLSNLGYLGASESEISVSVPSLFFQERFRSRYHNKFEEKLSALTGKKLSIALEVLAKNEGEDPQEKKTEVELASQSPKTPSQSAAAVSPTAKPGKKCHPQLQEDYTFETFVVSEDNSFAFNAASAVGRNPGMAKNYNPLLIYGGVGLGKTHLMQAIGHYIHNNTDLKILYITAEGFMRDFVETLDKKKMADFKKKYRSVDVLLIDDIHTIEKGAGTQEELFYTFEELYKNKKQMVFTCDRPVAELKGMAPRLQSRFQWGLHIDLKPPNYETRYAILKKKMENRNVIVPDEVIDLISKNISTNVRDLEGALNKLTAYSELLGKPVTLDIAQKELKDLIDSSKPGNLSVENIQRVVAEYYHLTPNDLKGRKRSKTIVRARHIAMYLIRNLTEYSFTDIGEDFGGKDHSTVLVSCEKIENECRTDSSLYSTIEELKRKIKEYGAKS
jgi:chromosomal replication initiator protein